MFRGTFAVVNKQAISSNVRRVRGLLAADTKLLIAVKANGYGHGMEQAADAALCGGADALGVASLEEALRLRDAAVRVPILVFGRVPVSGLQIAAEHHVSVTMTSDWREENVPTLSPKLNVHLKLDTGMRRLGFTDPATATEMAQWVANRDDLNLCGAYSHLATADDLQSELFFSQVQCFHQTIQGLEAGGVRPPLIHLANSAGTLRGQEYHCDMVRVGISAYGYPPSPNFPLPIQLQSALSLYARIQRVATIGVGETVGYGATFQAQRRTRVATIHVGYADGYSRLLSNRSHVWIRGQLAKVIGNVCMDQLMVDVTDVPGVTVGDWVTVYGQPAPDVWNGQDFGGWSHQKIVQFVEDTYTRSATVPPVVSLDTLADLTGTISYELMCALSSRVPRIYFEG